MQHDQSRRIATSYSGSRIQEFGVVLRASAVLAFRSAESSWSRIQECGVVLVEGQCGSRIQECGVVLVVLLCFLCTIACRFSGRCYGRWSSHHWH